MSRSQRHKIIIQNYPADCKITAEHVISPGYLRQPGPTYTVPVGPAGGPLQGSSLAGPAPSVLPNPLEMLVLGLILAGSQVPPEPPPTELTPKGGRSFPFGPFAIARVEDDPDGIALMLTIGDVRVGDVLLIEATGNSNINGVYSVLTSNDLRVVVDNTYELAAPIEGKGRVTVTEEA